MRVCWFGIYDTQYSRNKILIDGLRENGVEVIECNARGRGLSKYITLYTQLRALKNEYDFVYCAFPVYVCIFLAFCFQKKKIVTDAFFPQYDSLVHDRKKYHKFHPNAILYYVLDRAMIALSDLIIVDTNEHKDFFSRWRSPDDIFTVHVGAHTEEFYPIHTTKKDNRFLVQFHGSYIPLQGIGHIVEAARILKRDRNIRFRFIGAGQEYKKIKTMVAEAQLDIEFVSWLPIKELNQKLNEADIILGIFGDSTKTDRVVPNKLYQGLAVRKPVITKDTPAIRNYFSEQEVLLTSNNPEDIAKSICMLKDDSSAREQFAKLGYKKLREEFTQLQLGRRLLYILQSAI